MEAGPPHLSTIWSARAPAGAPRLDAFPAMDITTMPLIGSAQMQATAAIQTGVQTASFAASTAAAAAGGAIRARREGMEFRWPAEMCPGPMPPEQRARYGMLKEAGHDRMSMARAAMRRGWRARPDVRRVRQADAGVPEYGHAGHRRDDGRLGARAGRL